MLYRNKKKNDVNQGKWIGLGGKFERGESPEECLFREIKEEAGVIPAQYRLRGVITFVTYDAAPAEPAAKYALSGEPMYLFVYTVSAYEGEISACDEGTLAWVENEKIMELDLWEGDRLLWKWLLEDERFFSAKFEYVGERLVGHSVGFY
jgi:8-oxo-dGTP diphosphatase